MQRIHRFYEIRQAGDGIIAGTALDYADVADIAGRFKERFEPGSIAWEDVILNIQHDRRSPVARTGAGLSLHHTPESVTFKAELPNTRYGKEARELVSAGILRGASIEFEPLKETWIDDMRVITEARLWGIALVDRPAYKSSKLNRQRADALDNKPSTNWPRWL